MASKTGKSRSKRRPRSGRGRGGKKSLPRYGAQEFTGLIFGGVAVMLLLALISYAPSDLPSWVPFSRGDSPTSHNFIGPIGAIIAGYVYFFLGAAGFLIPAVLIWWAVMVIAKGKFLHKRNAVALAIFLPAAACLIEFQTILFQDWVPRYNLPKSAGGFFGHLLGHRFLEGALGSAGAFIFSVTVYLVTLIIITGIHPIQFVRVAKRRAHYHRENFDRETFFQRMGRLLSRKKTTEVRNRNSVLRPESPRRERNFSEIEPLPAIPDRPRKIIDAQRNRPARKTDPLFPKQKKPAPGRPRFENYQLPSLNLLSYGETPVTDEIDETALIRMQNTIVETLKSFGVTVEPGDITRGPTITRYEVYPAAGLRVNKITALKADLARATRAERIHILAPIPRKDTVGIEIANSNRVPVSLRELFEDDAFRKSKAKLPLALGKDVYGQTIVGDLAKMPHLLVAGATGSGKSVCINSIIASLLYRFTPDELKFIMIDPKVVEMQLYNDLPHMVVPVVTEAKKVLLALCWVINEMERRYAMFAKKGSRNFEGFNATRAREVKEAERARMASLQPDFFDGEADRRFFSEEDDEEEFPESLPYIVVIIDELADLMQTAPADVETGIARIAQKARAAGIHLIVATQTPRADVVTGIIKANIPSRIAFQVSSKTDSRIILDENGAENLVGKGDMLYLPPGSAQLVRAQGALITDDEALDLVGVCAAQGSPDFEGEAAEQIEHGFGEDEEEKVSAADEEILVKCMEVIFAEKKASTSLLQRRLRLGYTRAARMIDILENRGVIGPGNGAKAREILVDLSGE